MKIYSVDLKASTFHLLRAINEQRARRWHGADSVPWTGADWSNAMCGEAGEVANAVKKMRHLETGVSSNNSTQPLDYQHARGLIAKEIGDTIIYLDLLAAHYGIDLGEAVLHAFNTVSAREGFPELISLVEDSPRIERKELSTEEDTKRLRVEGATPDRLQLQSDEFKAVAELTRRYNALPPIVDDDYPEARHHYEAALRTFIDAIRANGRLDDLLHA